MCLLLAGCGQAAPDDWHVKGVAEVRAYYFNWEQMDAMSPPVVEEPNRLNATAQPDGGVLLSKAQEQTLREAVYVEQDEREWAAACYYPHHGFVLYDDGGDIVGHLSVCFLCSNHSGGPEGFADRWDLGAIRQLVTELGLPLANPDWSKNASADETANESAAAGVGGA